MIDIREKIGLGRAISVNIRGRVVRCRDYRGRRYTTVLSPATDAYSNPELFEIRSRGHLANKDQDVSCNCVLSGSVLPLDELRFSRNFGNEELMPLVLTLDLCETFDESMEY